jgi:hypothetical protein
MEGETQLGCMRRTPTASIVERSTVRYRVGCASGRAAAASAAVAQARARWARPSGSRRRSTPIVSWWSGNGDTVRKSLRARSSPASAGVGRACSGDRAPSGSRCVQGPLRPRPTWVARAVVTGHPSGRCRVKRPLPASARGGRRASANGHPSGRCRRRGLFRLRPRESGSRWQTGTRPGVAVVRSFPVSAGRDRATGGKRTPVRESLCEIVDGFGR